MITKQKALEQYKRNFITNFDIGEHLKEEFDQLIESRKYYHYSENIKDKFVDYLNWNEYGDFRNKIWNKLEDKKHNKIYYGFMDCALAVPLMEDRIGFIDMMDRQISNELCDIIYLMYKDEIEK
ncbi:MAG: hypothetical protein AABY22_12040 [Nanoarchaeota archaeon]